tara:strand:+ start:512 stop:1111 length:600 start_codon:yes stop_codon:yes gene_type:complete
LIGGPLEVLGVIFLEITVGVHLGVDVLEVRLVVDLVEVHVGSAAMVLVNLLVLLLLVTGEVGQLLALSSRILVGLLQLLYSADLLSNIITGGLVDVLYQVLLTGIIFVCLLMLLLWWKHLVLLKLIFGLITCIDHVGQQGAIHILAHLVSNVCGLLNNDLLCLGLIMSVTQKCFGDLAGLALIYAYHSLLCGQYWLFDL